MRLHRLLPLLAAAASLAAPAAASAAPTIAEHAIFSGGTSAPWHVGQVLDVLVKDAGGAKVQQVCWAPAPLHRPACDAGNAFGAPSATGTTQLAVTLDDGTVLHKTLRVVAARTRYDGHVPVRGEATCPTTKLYGSPPRNGRGFLSPLASATGGSALALYNHVGPRAIFAWDYATNRGGFAPAACVRH